MAKTSKKKGVEAGAEMKDANAPGKRGVGLGSRPLPARPFLRSRAPRRCPRNPAPRTRTRGRPSPETPTTGPGVKDSKHSNLSSSNNANG